MTAYHAPASQVVSLSVGNVVGMIGRMETDPLTIVGDMNNGAATIVGQFWSDPPQIIGQMRTDPLTIIGRWTKRDFGVANLHLDPRDADIRISENNNPTFEIRIQDDDGAYIETTDITALEWRIGPSPSAAATLSKSIGDFTTTNTTTFSIQLSAVETATLLGVTYHEVKATDTTGRIRTVAAGPFKCVDRIV